MASRIIDSINSLPPTATPINEIDGNPLPPIYFYDTSTQKIIKKFSSSYRYIRSNNITSRSSATPITFKNFKTQIFKVKNLIKKIKLNFSNEN